jgi:predicted permease
MTHFLADLRYAARQLLRQPGFTLVALLTLALGIGANTAMFSVVNGTMLAPLPYPDAGRLVRIWETTPEGHRFSVSEPNFLDFRERSEQFESLAAIKDVSLTFVEGGQAARLPGFAVSREFFSVLGHSPMAGRAFTREEDQPGSAADAVVLGHDLWQRRFGGDRDLVGRTIRVEGRARTVVGVMGPDFGLLDSEYWVPLAADPASDRGDHWLAMIGRLHPGATLQQAEAELQSIADGIGQQHPTLAGWGVEMMPFSRWLVRDSFRTTALLLLGAVGFVLLMACVNLANLIFARASRRQGELGLRLALGAGRGRLVRQLLVEAVLLCGLGLGLGIALAYWGVSALQAFGAGFIPRLESVRVDETVLAFAVGIGLVTVVLFGLLPALRISGLDLNVTLRQGGRAGERGDQRRVRDALVVVQIAMAMLLLVGAGLLLRSFWQLQSTDPGFDARDVVYAEIQLGDDYAEPWQKVVFFRELIEDLSSRPGVSSAGATVVTPFSGSNLMNDVTPVDRAEASGAQGFMQAAWRTATPEAFETLGLPLIEGRLYDYTDRWDGPRVAVVTRTMAERMWPDRSAVGRAFYWGSNTGEPLRVIGVVDDFRDVEMSGDVQPVMFLPYHHLPWPKMTLLVRGSADADAIARLIQSRVRALDESLPVPAVASLQDQADSIAAGPRFRTFLMASFAGLALLLAAVGIYGVMAYNVSQRTREVGLRMALGAAPGSISAMLVRRGAMLTVLGTLIGLLGAWVVTRFIQGLLFATEPLDPTATATAAFVLALTALAASWLPARRAARIQPTEALRHE